MQTFLDGVAERIVASSHSMDQVKIIVPSVRAIHYLKESFKKVIDQPLIAPEIISISEFIKALSGINTTSKIDLLYIFYQVYQNQTPKNEWDSFDQFLSWAPTLLSEFNEVDTQLVKAQELFDYMSALGSLEHWGAKEKGSLSSRHFRLQEKAFNYYNKLYKSLLSQQKGYQGLQMREAVKNLTFYLQQDLPHHFFVGFNALTEAEATLVQELIAEDKGEVIWDLDHSFYEDPYHTAGHFIRNYHKNWNVLNKGSKPKFEQVFTQPKQIEQISAAGNSIQAKAAVQIASSLYRANPKEKTVLVLADEELVHPLLSALPKDGFPWNLTMGYPLKGTLLSSFYRLVFELHQNYEERGFSSKRINELVNTAPCQLILKSVGSIVDMTGAGNQKFFKSENLCQFGTVSVLLFKPFDTIKAFIERLGVIALSLQKTYLDNNKFFEAAVCERINQILESLLKRHIIAPFISSLTELKRVFEFLLQNESFDFTGNPLEGVQIMGVLETRLLDFDNVIITSVNEGVLPNGKTPFSWIPFDVRKKFGLNTFIEQDHIYAYHFFRLLQRAKRVSLIYNASAQGLFSGERSRFLLQLEYFKQKQHTLDFKKLELPVPKLEEKGKQIPKTEEVLNCIERVGQEGFSPSSLSLYIRNPLAFYEERILKIKQPSALDDQLSSREKGTIMHEVLEKLYLPYCSKTLDVDAVDKMLELLPKTLEQCFNSTPAKGLSKTGKNALLYQIMEAVIQHFLKQEKKQLEEGNSIQIIALEHQFKKTVEIAELNKKIHFKGTVDRIDRYNGTLRFVDYKTGKVTPTDCAFSDWEELIIDPKKSPLFQVMMYVYLLREEFNNEPITGGVIPLKNFDTNFLAVSLKEHLRKKNSLILEEVSVRQFELVLLKLLGELYDPAIPLEERPV